MRTFWLFFILFLSLNACQAPSVVSSARPPQPGPRTPDLATTKSAIDKDLAFSTASFDYYNPPGSYEVFQLRKEDIKNNRRIQTTGSAYNKSFSCRPEVIGGATNGPSFQMEYDVPSEHHNGAIHNGEISMHSLGNKLILERLSFNANSGPWGWHINFIPNAVQTVGNLEQNVSFNIPIPQGATFSWGESSGDVFNLSGSLAVQMAGNTVTVQINASGSVISHNLHQFGKANGLTLTGTASFNTSKSIKNCGIGTYLSIYEEVDLENPENDQLVLDYAVSTENYGNGLPFSYHFVDGEARDSAGTCPPFPPRSAQGQLTFSEKHKGRYADGFYSAEAFFDDYPQQKSIAYMSIIHPLQLELFPSELHTSPDNPDNLPYDHVEFAASGPLCPDWILRIPVRTAAGACTWEEHGSGFKEGINWDLTCNGQKVLPGLYQAELTMPDFESGIKRPIKILGCVSGPQPSQEPTYDPSGYPIPPAYTPPPCEQEEKDICEEAAFLQPEEVEPAVNALPGRIIDSSLQSNLSGHENQDKKIKSLTEQLQEAGYDVSRTDNPPPASNQIKRKIENLLPKYAQAVTARENYTANIQSQMQQVDSTITAIEAQNAQTENITFENFVFEGAARPVSFEDYKRDIDALKFKFDAYLDDENTVSLLKCIQILSNELKIHKLLVQDYLEQKFAQIPENSSEDEFSYDYENEKIGLITQPRTLIRFLSNRLNQQRERIYQKHEKIKNEVTALFSEVDALDQELSELEAELASIPVEDESSFSILSHPEEIAGAGNPGMMRWNAGSGLRQAERLQQRLARSVKLRTDASRQISLKQSRDKSIGKAIQDTNNALKLKPKDPQLLKRKQDLTNEKHKIKNEIDQLKKVDANSQKAQHKIDILHNQIFGICGLKCQSSWLKKNWKTTDDTVKLLKDPKSIWGKSVDQIKKLFEDNGYKMTLKAPDKGTSEKAIVYEVSGHSDINKVQYHPGGGVHGGSYYKIETKGQSSVKVVGDDYKFTADPDKHGTLFYYKY
jgi:hypothetical protein